MPSSGRGAVRRQRALRKALARLAPTAASPRTRARYGSPCPVTLPVRQVAQGTTGCSRAGGGAGARTGRARQFAPDLISALSVWRSPGCSLPAGTSMRAANCALLVRGMAMPAAVRSAQLALRAAVDLAGLLPASVRRAGRLRPGRRVRRHPPTRDAGAHLNRRGGGRVAALRGRPPAGASRLLRLHGPGAPAPRHAPRNSDLALVTTV